MRAQRQRAPQTRPPPPAPRQASCFLGGQMGSALPADEDLLSGPGTEALPTVFREEVAGTAPRFSVWKGLHGHVTS